MRLVEHPTTFPQIALCLNSKPRESLLGRKCTLVHNGVAKPAVIASYSFTSYRVEALDGTASRIVAKAAAHQQYPEF